MSNPSVAPAGALFSLTLLPGAARPALAPGYSLPAPAGASVSFFRRCLHPSGLPRPCFADLSFSRAAGARGDGLGIEIQARSARIGGATAVNFIIDARMAGVPARANWRCD